MTTYWEVDTNGKPLETVKTLLNQIWKDLQLDYIMLPLKNLDDHNWEKEIISSTNELDRSNPFTPIMVENISRYVPEFIEAHPEKNLAVLLRPCELRAFKKIQEIKSLNTDHLTIISADCLGTFPEDEYSWRATRKGSQENLAQESIRFSSQGGIAPYRYRAACQLCKNPIADESDININIAGLPIRQKILISTSNGKAEKLHFTDLNATKANDETIDRHKITAEKMIYRNENTQNRLTDVLVENTELNIDSLVVQLNECGECTSCMDVCPICTTSHFSKSPDSTLSRDMVAEWMIDCVGCGMCEQACSQHKPLAVIFSIINKQLDEINSTKI